MSHHALTSFSHGLISWRFEPENFSGCGKPSTPCKAVATEGAAECGISKGDHPGNDGAAKVNSEAKPREGTGGNDVNVGPDAAPDADELSADAMLSHIACMHHDQWVLH